MRRVIVAVVAAAFVAGAGATPAWASQEFFAAQALQARTVQAARDAATFNTVPAETEPPAADPVAVETLSPDTPVTVDADEVGATVDFSGFGVTEDLALEVVPLDAAVAASAGSELAAQVLADPIEVTATTEAGAEVTEFPAEPTFKDPYAANPVLLDVDPGVELSIDVPAAELEGIDPASVRIVTRENPGDPWVELPSYYDAETGAALAVSDHLSQFAVIGIPFVPPRGPRIVLDPDDDVGTTMLPTGPQNELSYNLQLANALKAQLETMCLADVMITRNDINEPFVSRDFRAARAAAWNPDITVTIAFNALTGTVWGGNPEEGGSLVWGRGTGADTALRDSLVGILPGYTSRPARVGSDPQYPWSEFGGLPGAMVHLETLFIDNSDDRGVLDSPDGWGFVTSGVATGLGMYAESALDADCTDPVTGGWPTKPSAAQIEAWKQLGYHYYQTYGGDPVSMSTGNLLEDEPLFTLASPGAGDLDLTLIYNSQDGRESRVGTGWSFGLGARAQRFYDGSVLVVRGDGASVVFNPDGAGGYTSDADVHDTLVEAGLGQLKLTSPAGETWIFDAADIEGIGELASYRDALGAGYDLAYATPDGDDQFVPLTSITDAAGQTITVTQNPAGQIATLTHPDGRTWTLAYDTGGDLTTITNPDGRVRTFTYDAEHRILTAVDAAGVTYLRNQYDAAGRVVKQWDADDNLRRFDYMGAMLTGGSTVYTNNEGNKTTYEWDERSRITSITDAAGGIETFDYDEAGNTIAHTDQLGNTKRYEYDGAGRLTRQLLPDGTTRSYTYTPLGIAASVTDQGGTGAAARTTTFDVTPTGLTTAAHLPDGSTITFTYTAAGDLASTTDQAGNTTSFGYDPVGNLVSVTDPLGQVTTNSYDGTGRVVATTDPTGATTSFSWDAGDRLAASTDPLGATTTYGYDALDHVTSVTDALGAVTSFEWDAMFHLISVTAPNGGVTTYEYDTEDNLTATIDPLGARTVIERDELGRPIATTDALGNQWNSAYDALGQIVKATDPLGAATTFSYDELGQLTAVTDPSGATTTSAYDAVGRLASVADGLGGTTRYTYTLTDQVASTVDEAGKTTRYSYDPVGQPTTVTDRRGQKWTSAYDALGRVTSETDPTGAATSYAYDPLARTIATTDPLGATTTSALDAAGRLVSVTDPLGAVTTATYDAVGNLLTTTDANGAVSIAAYDLSGQVTKLTNALGAASTFAYDVAGRLTTTTNPLGITTGYRYDPLGQLTTVTDGVRATPTTATGSDVNVTTGYTYTPTGALATITDPMGALTRYEYDARGLPVAETNPLGITSRTSYDALGRPTSSTDGTGATTTTSYTARSDVASVAYPDGTRVGFEYDADQHPIVMTDALGATGWTYDAASRQRTQTDPTGTTLRWGYDRAGQTTSLAASGTGTIGYSYDAAGRLAAQTSPWGSLGYRYDPVGNLTEQTRSTGVTTTYNHDTVGQVTQIQHHTPVVDTPNPSSAEWISTPTPTDALKQCPAGTSVVDSPVVEPGSPVVEPGSPVVEPVETSPATSYLSDRTPPAAGTIAGCEKTSVYAGKRDLPAAADVFSAGENITYDYRYDLVGNVTAERETLGSASVTDTGYAYDRLDRLTQSWDSTGVVNAYTYDRAGNRTGWITPSAPDTGEPLIVGAAYNAAGQLTSQYRARPEDGATTVAYTYDRAGNRTAENTSGPDGSSTTSYGYTSTGRLASVTEKDVSTTYGYDGLGRNLTVTQESWAGTDVTTRSWDGLQPVRQTNTTAGAALLLRDVSGMVALQSAAAVDGASGTLWNLHDRLGSTIATTTGDGYVTDLADYSDFGMPTHQSTGFAGSAGFTGELASPTTGLNSYYARSYDPFAATWLTPDAYRGTMADPGSQNRYGYVEGNPATYIDHLGNRLSDPGAYAVHPKGGGSGSDDPPPCARHCIPGSDAADTASDESKTSAAHPPVCLNPGPRGMCTAPMTQAQKDAQQNMLAILGGIGVGVGITAAILGIAGCTLVTFGACGVAVGVGALAAGGLASSVMTYHWSTGEKSPEGYTKSALWGAGTSSIFGLAGPAVSLLRPGVQGLTYAPQVLAPGVSQASSTTANTTVGRWMGQGEYDAMVRTGEVQVSMQNKTTYVANPASPAAFEAQAKPGSVYVEFDVPSSALRPAGTPDWAQIPSPEHPIYGPLAQRSGSPLEAPIRACNIVLVGSKC